MRPFDFDSVILICLLLFSYKVSCQNFFTPVMGEKFIHSINIHVFSEYKSKSVLDSL